MILFFFCSNGCLPTYIYRYAAACAYDGDQCGKLLIVISDIFSFYYSLYLLVELAKIRALAQQTTDKVQMIVISQKQSAILNSLDYQLPDNYASSFLL